ncbi:ras-related protein Rap-2c isoform X1 [Myotis daubentonii]|uniref:ras-related protein Rap-2c isoform X1 n=1 Tax=Myotis daubentonii TaxID=98922 RepID=UPI002873CDC2|nr:ras-related protein Rap-2c isoform X1 [Myotis daubentonii]
MALGWDCQQQQNQQQLRAGAERKGAGGPPRGPLPRPQPRPETVPSRLAQQGAARAQGPRSEEVGLSPPEVIRSSLGELGHLKLVCQGNPSGPDNARGSRGSETRPAAVEGAEPTGLGQLSSESRKRGPWAPLCEGRGRGGGSPWLRAPPSLACPPGPQICGFQPSPRGARFFSPPSPGFSWSALLPTPPAWALVPIGGAFTISSPPTPTLRSLPSPRL